MPTYSYAYVTAPVEVDASVDVVWSVVMDFEAYGEWNPLHRRVRVLKDEESGERAVEMMLNPHATKNGPLASLADPVQRGALRKVPVETLLYVDHVPGKRAVLVYGLVHGPVATLATSARVQLVLPRGPRRSVYLTFDVVGGVALAPFLWMLPPYIERGFEAAAWALKGRAEALAMGGAASSPSPSPSSSSSLGSVVAGREAKVRSKL